MLSLFLLIGSILISSCTSHFHHHEEAKHEGLEHHCIHDAFHENFRKLYGEPTTAHQKYSSKGRSLSTAEPLRIHLEYDDTSDLSSAELNKLKTEIMPAAVNWLQSALKVQRVSGNFFAVRNCALFYTGTIPSSSNQYKNYDGKLCKTLSSSTSCGPATIPSSWFATTYTCGTSTACTNVVTHSGGSGLPNTDVAIFVQGKATTNCGSSTGSGTLGYATHCMRDQFDRPIMGYINICPRLFDASADYTQQVTTVIHELTHVLGFAANLIPLFRDSNNNMNPRTTRNSYGSVDYTSGQCVDGVTRTKQFPATTTMEFKNTRDTRANVLSTPEVKAKGREYFGCTSLDGVELENQPTSSGGCWGSHWDERVLADDLMSPVVGSNQHVALSQLTLAFLQDSGWYHVNYTAASRGISGYRAGCDFVQNKCITNGNVVSGGETRFCNVNDAVSCTMDRRAFGVCRVSTYTSNLPSAYQYFSDPKKGGSVGVADYCPNVVQYSNRRCNSGPWSTSNPFLATYSETSRCFDVENLARGGSYVNGRYAACYEYTCNLVNANGDPASQSDSVTISMGGSTGTSVTCTRAQEFDKIVLNSGGFSGKIICPDIDSLCGFATDNLADPNSTNSNPSSTTPSSSSSSSTKSKPKDNAAFIYNHYSFVLALTLSLLIGFVLN